MKEREEAFKPTSMFSLLGEKAKAEDVNNIVNDDEVKKLDRLMLINASARYELITANSMLIDFHLNRVMRCKKKQPNSPNQVTMRQNDLQNDVIGELPEAEDLYTNKKSAKKKIDVASKDQVKSIIDIGNQVSALAGQLSHNMRNNNHSSEPKSGKQSKEQSRAREAANTEPPGHKKERGSLFGTLHMGNVHDYDSRLKLM